MILFFVLFPCCDYIIPPNGGFVNRFREIFLLFSDLFCNGACNYVVLDFFGSLVGNGDEDGRAGRDCPVEITPHVAVGGDDVAAATVDGCVCAALVTLLLDGGAGDYAQQDDEGE